MRQARRLSSAMAIVVAVVSLTAACGAGQDPGRGDASAPSPLSASGAPGAPGTSPRTGTAITHIHALAREPQTGKLMLATHEGLFVDEPDGLRRRGPVMDLMGFAADAEGRLYASGHPGVAATDLPQPLGLIRSSDAGRSWSVLSRGGSSDFHALAAGPTKVVGFDGQLRITSDGRTWTTRAIPAPPRWLASAPSSGQLLATTQTGLLTSTDDGSTWRTIPTPKPAVLASWADEQSVVISTTDGHLAISTDRGDTWKVGSQSVGAVDAMWAGRGADGTVEVLFVSSDTVSTTTDLGATTRALLGPDGS